MKLVNLVRASNTEWNGAGNDHGAEPIGSAPWSLHTVVPCALPYPCCYVLTHIDFPLRRSLTAKSVYHLVGFAKPLQELLA